MTEQPLRPSSPPAAGQPPPGWIPQQPGGPPPGHGWAQPAPGGPPPVAVPRSPSGRPLASFVDRLLAYLIDSAILAGIYLVLLVPAMVLLVLWLAPRIDESAGEPALGEILGPMLAFQAYVLVLVLVITYLYSVESMFRRGQTVGKRAMRLRIEPVEPGRALDRGMAVRRWLVQYGASVVPGLGYVDGLWQLWDKPLQQCLHDKYAKTVVVKLERGAHG